MKYVAGISNGSSCGLPVGSQRENYDFATAQGPSGLWWYGGGTGRPGPQRKCTAEEKKIGIPGHGPGTVDVFCGSGWPSFIIDHPAVRNRMWQWATFLYDTHGELLYEMCAGFANPGPQDRGFNGTDGWDQQLTSGGNGEGTLLYPGRPDKIGGKTHIPVGSLRMVMIREGQEDYEWLMAAARVVGRERVEQTMAPVMTSARNFTSRPEVIWSTREVLAALIVG